MIVWDFVAGGSKVCCSALFIIPVFHSFVVLHDWWKSQTVPDAIKCRALAVFVYSCKSKWPWGYIILLLLLFGDDIWVWAHGKEERGGEPQFGGSGNGRYNNFYRTIITINKGGLPSLKYVAKQYKYSPTCLQIFEIREEKEKWLFHSNGNRIEAFLFISFVCFLRQLWQSFCPSQKAPLIAFQTNCLRKMFCFNTRVRD